MGLETATYISQLVDTNPTTSDPVSQGDDHLRLIKSVLQDQFTTLGAAAVTTTAAELNLLDGVTSLGDVAGPGSSTDNAIARFDGTGGKTLQNSSTTIDDNGDIVVGGTTPTITIGDGGAEDAALIFDGNAKDFHIGLDDTADKLVIGDGSALGTNSILTLTDDTVTLGDGAAVDTYLNFDGATADFRIGIDDGTDKLEIGGGIAHGTAAGISMDVNGDMTLGGSIACEDEVVSKPRFTDYSETVNAIGTITAGTNADLEDGNVQTVTFTANTFNFGITNAIGSHGSALTLVITNGGLATPTWVSGAHGGGGNAVDWAGGTAPTLTSSGVDILVFTTSDGGTQWMGFAAGLDIK
jgi:hypothetical protein